MNYFKFNEEYMQIYKERFRVIDNTDFEYSYLESEIYAIRKIGESDFVIVTARSPQQALDKLLIKKVENLILDEYKINYEKYIKYYRNLNFEQKCTALQDVLFRLGIGMDVIGDIEDDIKEKYNDRVL